jgi:hypothetical protein
MTGEAVDTQVEGVFARQRRAQVERKQPGRFDPAPAPCTTDRTATLELPEFLIEDDCCSRYIPRQPESRRAEGWGD